MIPPLPWFKRADYYYDIIGQQLYYLSEGPEPVFATYTFPSQASGSASAWTRMTTTATDLETDKDYLFFQWFFSILKKGLIYKQYPVGEEVYTTDKLVPNTSIGQEYACLDYKMSPYNDPAAETEFFIIKGITVALAYYDDQPIPLAQKIKFIGKKFRQDPLGIGTVHLGKTLTADDITAIMQKARPLYMRRVS